MVEVFNLGIEVAALIFCVFIFYMYSMRAVKYESSKLFFRSIFLEILLLFSDIMECLSVIYHWNVQMTTLFLSLDYVISYGFVLLFHHYILKKIEEVSDTRFSSLEYNYGAVLLAGVYISFIANIYTGVIFHVLADNTVIYNRFSTVINLVYMIICSFDIWQMYLHRQYFSKKKLTLFILYPLLIIGVFPLDTIYGTSFTYVVIALILVLNILNVALEQDNLLHETQLNTLHLQMRPHFIYNTLASISGLCYMDAAKAAEYIGIFSRYLRMSFGDMTSKSMITFREEMKHLDLYLTIEQLRFADMEVETDYQVTDFELPCLTVQPLVENAIKHGICGREDGGSLQISSFETETEYLVQVKDNGVGFTEVPKDGRKHIGIENVKTRLEIHNAGWLEMYSVPGEGTTATVHLKKK